MKGDQTFWSERGIKAVCFDAFGTLVEITDKRRPYVKLLKLASPAQRRTLKPRLMREALSIEACLSEFGLSVGDPEAQAVLADLEAECSSILFRRGLPEIWQQLRADDLRIAVCSNLAAPYGPPLEAMLPDRPDALILSYEAGAVKPEPEIYRLVCDRLDLEPGQVLFCGDTPLADVDGPRAAGMQAMLIRAFETEQFGRFLWGTSPSRYISFVRALNVRLPSEDTGDWHFWREDFPFKVPLAGPDSEGLNSHSALGALGVRDMASVLARHNIGDGSVPIYVADHYRAIADIAARMIVKDLDERILTNRTINAWLDTEEQVETLRRDYLTPLGSMFSGDQAARFEAWLEGVFYEERRALSGLLF